MPALDAEGHRHYAAYSILPPPPAPEEAPAGKTQGLAAALELSLLILFPLGFCSVLPVWGDSEGTPEPQGTL